MQIEGRFVEKISYPEAEMAASTEAFLKRSLFRIELLEKQVLMGKLIVSQLRTDLKNKDARSFYQNLIKLSHTLIELKKNG